MPWFFTKYVKKKKDIHIFLLSILLCTLHTSTYYFNIHIFTIIKTDNKMKKTLISCSAFLQVSHPAKPRKQQRTLQKREKPSPSFPCPNCGIAHQKPHVKRPKITPRKDGAFLQTSFHWKNSLNVPVPTTCNTSMMNTPFLKMHDITLTTLQSSGGKTDINLPKATGSSIKGGMDSRWKKTESGIYWLRKRHDGIQSPCMGCCPRNRRRQHLLGSQTFTKHTRYPERKPWIHGWRWHIIFLKT